MGSLNLDLSLTKDFSFKSLVFELLHENKYGTLPNENYLFAIDTLNWYKEIKVELLNTKKVERRSTLQSLKPKNNSG